jgi:hypothetical protein
LTPLIDQRCFNHSAREAVVRCPGCRRFYCRECVTEHHGRMICAVCAAGETAEPVRKSSMAGWIAGACAGFLLAWLMFYYLGVMLARIPSDFFAKL